MVVSTAEFIVHPIEIESLQHYVLQGKHVSFYDGSNDDERKVAENLEREFFFWIILLYVAFPE